MARELHKREDLLRDARALTPRALLRVELGGKPAEVFAGFRGQALSLYFDDDPVFHFNAAGELRRAYVGDRLIKAERGRLVAMERKRTAGKVVLEAFVLDAQSQQMLLSDLSARLADLAAALSAGDAVALGQIPADSDAVERIKAWLADHSAVAIAKSPRVG